MAEMIPEDADWIVRAYDRGRLLAETWHRGEVSKDVEVAAWRSRMARGECTLIEIEDRSRPYYPIARITRVP